VRFSVKAGFSTFSLNGFNKMLDTIGITYEEMNFEIANEDL